MTTPRTVPPYMRRYFIRLMAFISIYVVVLVVSLSIARNGAEHGQPTLAALAILSALPILGVFWTIYRLLVEMTDEYQRMLMIKQTLLATAITLAIATVWQFLATYEVVALGPQWISAIWLAMWGVAAPIARWRA